MYYAPKSNNTKIYKLARISTFLVRLQRLSLSRNIYKFFKKLFGLIYRLSTQRAEIWRSSLFSDISFGYYFIFKILLMPTQYLELYVVWGWFHKNLFQLWFLQIGQHSIEFPVAWTTLQSRKYLIHINFKKSMHRWINSLPYANDIHNALSLKPINFETSIILQILPQLQFH